MAAVVDDLLAGREKADISAAFHRTMAEMVAACCRTIRDAGGPSAVALSGGTFQNVVLLQQTADLLRSNGFVVYRHRRVPANDGGLCLGQAVLAEHRLRDVSG
jgi:hydrogenase maturation protein HypF